MANAFLKALGTHYGPSTLLTANNFGITDANRAVGWVVQAHTTSAITKVRFRYGARTGTPPAFTLTIEGVDSTGLPNGTDLGGGSPTAKNFTPPADATWDGTIREITLTNSYTPSAATDILAFTIRPSGTPDGSNNSSFTRAWSDMCRTNGFPYNLARTSGTWSKQSTWPNVAWVTSSRTYGQCVLSAQSTQQTVSGKRQGAYFTLPSGHGTTYSVTGIKFVGLIGSTGNTAKVGIWNTSGTEQGSYTIDGDVHTSPTDGSRSIYVYFATPITLNYGTKYYAAVESISNSTVELRGLNFDASGDMQGFPNGDNVGAVSYDGSTWTEVATTYPHLELILSDITVPSGSGGALLIGGSLVI